MRRLARVLGIALLASAAPSSAGELVVSEPERFEVRDGAVTARIYLDRTIVKGGEASMTRLTIAAGTTLPLHAHPDSLEVVYVISGEAEMLHAAGSTKVTAGAAVVIPAGAVHGLQVGGAPVEAIQMYLAAGPEQRYRDDSAKGSVPPEQAVKGAGAVKVIPGTAAPTRKVGSKEYRFLVEKEPAGKKRSCDLALIKRPGGQKADLHGHDGVSELIYILSGNGRVTIDGKSWDVAPGTAYYTPEGSEMGLASTSPLETLLLVVNHE